MRALVYTAPRQLNIEDHPGPQPGAGEVEIAVDAGGICGADLSGFLGQSRRRKPPLIFGHEVVGRTADGRRVVADPLMGCGHCVECRRGAKNLCSGLRLLGMDRLAGCFAEFVTVPAVAGVRDSRRTSKMRGRFLRSRWRISFTCFGWLRRRSASVWGLLARGRWVRWR